MREIKDSKLLQKARVHIAKIKPGPDLTENKERIKENKVRAINYKASGEIHKYLKEIR